MQRLLDACRDELSVLFENETENERIIESVQHTVDKLFGPQEPVSETIDLKNHIQHYLAALQPRFNHRKCMVNKQLEDCDPITMPKAILDIILKGCIRNAVEYTPDGSQIDIILKTTRGRPEFIVKDAGIGITEEKQRLIFGNFFTPPESQDYSTKTPFDFNAGGRGFDLLRIKLFSEKYPFSIQIESKRCPIIPKDTDLCPGDIKQCESCSSKKDCLDSGGTAIHILFD